MICTCVTGQREKALLYCPGGGAGFSNFHQVQIPLYTLDGKGSTSGRLGRQGGAGHTIFKRFGKNGCFSLWYSGATRMACLHTRLSGCYQRHCFEWEEEVICSSSHMLLLLLLFLKLCDLERRWTVWMMHGLPRALGVISLFIPPGRKKWVQANDSTPWTE